jgi:hypothetical protein
VLGVVVQLGCIDQEDQGPGWPGQPIRKVSNAQRAGCESGGRAPAWQVQECKALSPNSSTTPPPPPKKSLQQVFLCTLHSVCTCHLDFRATGNFGSMYILKKNLKQTEEINEK